MGYHRVDVTISRRGREALRLLGRTGVPTTLVGLKVIKGSDSDAVRKALAKAK